MSDKCEKNNSPNIPEILADFFLKKLDMPSHSDDSDHRHKNKRKKSKHKKRKHKKSKHRYRHDSSDSSSRDSDLNSKDVVDDVSSSEEMGIKRLKKIKSMKLQSVNNTVLQSVNDDPQNKDKSDPSNSAVSENLVFYGPSLQLLISGVEANSSTSKVDEVANISLEESKIDVECSLKNKESSLVNNYDKLTIDRKSQYEKSPDLLVPLQAKTNELEPKIIHNNTMPICDSTTNDDKNDANKDNISLEEKSCDIQIKSNHNEAKTEHDSKNVIEKDKNSVTKKDLDPKMKQNCKDKKKKHSRSRSRSKSHSKHNSPKSKHRKRSSRSSSRESDHLHKKSKRFSRSRSNSRGRFKSHEHKRNSRSRNRSRSRYRKPKGNSRSPTPYDRYRHRRIRSRSRSRARLRKNFNSRSRSRSRARYRKRSNSRSRSRSRVRPRKRSNSRSRSRSHARPRKRSHSRTRRRSISKHRERCASKSRHQSNYKKRSTSHSRSRSKSKSKQVPSSKEKSRSRSKSKELKSSQSSNKIDQAKILETARKNVLKMMKNGTLPDGLPVENLKKEQLISIHSGGKSVQELTDFCQRLSQKENELDSDNEDKDDKPDDETGFIHHPFKIKEPGMIKLNIKNAIQLPIKTHAQKVAELSSQFPVSSGNQHKQKELEWIPVVPEASKKETKPVVTAVSTKTEPTKTVDVVSETPAYTITPPASSIPMPVSYPASYSEPPVVEAPVVTPPLLPPPLPPAPPPMPVFQPPMQPPPAFQVPVQPVTLSYVMPNQEVMNSYASPPAIRPPSTSIFKPPKKLDIPAIVAKRFQALTKLQENPNDPDALKVIHDAQESIQEWVESQQVPGLFTGSTDAKVLTAAELCGPKYHKFRKKIRLFILLVL